jgi:hypothetical protein
MEIGRERDYIRQGFEKEVWVDRAGIQVKIERECGGGMGNLQDGEL